MSLLSVRNLCVGIGTAMPVEDVSFDVAAGETFALLGESGCGKSLTALALLRLLPEAARICNGEVRFAGDDLCALTEAEMRKVRGGKVAMIFQEPGASLNPVLTVGDQIAEALACHDGRTVRERVVALLEAVGIPDAVRRANEYPFQMSGGMKQRVMIAMALAGEPDLLIADEPTTALDVTIQAQVLDLLAALQRARGMALLLITHDLGVVARMADRIGVMYSGQLVEVTRRDLFFAAPGHPYARRLFAALPDASRASGSPARLATIPGNVPPLGTRFVGCRFAARCAEALPVCSTQPPPWRAYQPGQAVRCHLPGVPGNLGDDRTAFASGDTEPSSSPLLDVRDLQVHFPIRHGVLQRVVGHIRAVDGISLSLPAGKTLALVGESGCGKTTAGKAILGLLPPTGGTVRYDGKIRTGIAPAAMQMVFQDPFGSLNPRLRVGEIVVEGLQAISPAEATTDTAAQLLAQVGLSAEMAARYPHEFSGGQRQRIAIARALAVKPRVLICDEPTSALDVSVQAQILNLLDDLQVKHGLSYLFITHNIAVVEHLADRVAVMYLGRVVEEGTVEAVLGNPRHPYTQALLSAVLRLDGHSGERLRVPGDPPSPAQPPSGCYFHPRCPRATSDCRMRYPEAQAISADHRVHCFNAV